MLEAVPTAVKLSAVRTLPCAQILVPQKGAPASKPDAGGSRTVAKRDLTQNRKRRILSGFGWPVQPERGSTGVHEMERKKLELFQKKLLQKQQELMQAVARNEQDGRAADEEATQDIADKATNSYTKEFLFHQSNADRGQLQLVNDALARLREGSYGECTSCGEELNLKRLEAVPWAGLCINCQEKVEQGVVA